MAWRQRIMRRSSWITFHLCVASFFAPVLLMMAISGGLYLLGIEGSVKETPVAVPSGASLDLTSHHLEDEVRELLMDAGIDHRFEYVGGAGHDHSAGGHGHDQEQEGEAVTLTTYPTSQVYYVLQIGEGGVQVTRHEPDGAEWFLNRLVRRQATHAGLVARWCGPLTLCSAGIYRVSEVEMKTGLMTRRLAVSQRWPWSMIGG